MGDIRICNDVAMALDPVLMAQACGIEPDEKQAAFLRSRSPRSLLCCSRQWGKSFCAGLAALHVAVYEAPALVVVVSPSLQQSTECYRTINALRERLPGAPDTVQESLTRMQLTNGSRIISLPGTEKTVRGYSGASLIVVDEASRVDDLLVSAVMPMLATVEHGRFVALSTPAGRRGFFFEQWTQGGDGWERISVPASQCPRISPAFLEEQRRTLGPLLYSQEYECSFVDSGSSAFSSTLIAQALSLDFEPFFDGVA
jgi:hypothetical protein